MAKINTPAVGNRFSATIREPGHIIETQKPVNAQAKRPNIAISDIAAVR
jgi:hypothetical protein